MKTLDPKDKLKMEENFKTSQAHRKMTHRLHSNIVHVRSMVANGDVDAAMALWDDTLCDDIDCETSLPPHDDDHDQGIEDEE